MFSLAILALSIGAPLDALAGVCISAGLLALVPLCSAGLLHTMRVHPEAARSVGNWTLILAFMVEGVGITGYLELRAFIPPSSVVSFLQAVTAILAVVGCAFGFIGVLIVLVEIAISSLRRG